jgi:hypothetical protein
MAQTPTNTSTSGHPSPPLQPVPNPFEIGFSASSTGAEGPGVLGISASGKQASMLPAAAGVRGLDGAGGGVKAPKSSGVFGDSENGNGVYGSSAHWNGVQGDSGSSSNAGVAAINRSGGPAVWGQSSGNAGEFHGNVLCTGNQTVQGTHTVHGNVIVNGDIFLSNQDCAEDFDVAEAGLDSGTVVVITAEGGLRSCAQAYDRKVAGVISGAGDFRPAITLGREANCASRRPVALLGKVYCKVDATYSPVEVGDLLTTSPTPGHAMKATDPARAFGAIIGKALRDHRAGQGLVPILIALQ